MLGPLLTLTLLPEPSSTVINSGSSVGVAGRAVEVGVVVGEGIGVRVLVADGSGDGPSVEVGRRAEGSAVARLPSSIFVVIWVADGGSPTDLASALQATVAQMIISKMTVRMYCILFLSKKPCKNYNH